MPRRSLAPSHVGAGVIRLTMRQSPFGGPASDALTDFVNKERCFIYETLELPKQYLEMFQHLSIFGLGTSSDKRIPQGAPPLPAALTGIGALETSATTFMRAPILARLRMID